MNETITPESPVDSTPAVPETPTQAPEQSTETSTAGEGDTNQA